MSQAMPIGFAFALVGGIGVILLKGFGPGFLLMASAPYTWASNGALLAIPLFVLMGQFVFAAGISTELYQTAYKWVGRLPGGLAMATDLSCTAFGACCGASLAAAATFGTVSYPQMENFHYSRRLATGCIVAGGSLSSLIPPSMPFIIYGVLTETSIATLFIAGIFPGLLLSSLYIIMIFIICIRNPQLGPPGPSYPWRERLDSLKGIIGVLILFLLVMGGLFAGVFAPAEAGAIGAFGAFVIALVRRRLTTSTLFNSLRETVTTTCFILTITMGAMIFSNLLALGSFSLMFNEWVATIPVSRHIIMICILFIYIPLGMVMDVLAMILLTLPIVFPIVIHFGFDPIWFGIMLTLLAEMGGLTPPVALNVYVVSGVTKVPLDEIFYGVIPFFIVMLACLIFLYAFPPFTLFLPGLMM